MKKVEKSIAPKSQDVFKSMEISSSDLVVRILTFQAHGTEGSSSAGFHLPCLRSWADCTAGNASPP